MSANNSHLKVIVTGDGSSTIYNSELDETYHSQHGAVTESLHVFIDNGVKKTVSGKSNLSILEVGLGTGLNVFLTFNYGLSETVNIDYHVLEPYPLPQELIDQLNYQTLIQNEKLDGIFSKIHSSNWEQNIVLSKKFNLLKIHQPLESFITNHTFDLIFFDAFGPTKQSEMWTLENFMLLNQMTKPGGRLVSYGASGQFRRNLTAAGFSYTSLPGPPGKKEMTTAIKIR